MTTALLATAATAYLIGMLLTEAVWITVVRWLRDHLTDQPAHLSTRATPRLSVLALELLATLIVWPFTLPVLLHRYHQLRTITRSPDSTARPPQRQPTSRGAA